jgi:hypothetical protein
MILFLIYYDKEKYLSQTVLLILYESKYQIIQFPNRLIHAKLGEIEQLHNL